MNRPGRATFLGGYYQTTLCPTVSTALSLLVLDLISHPGRTMATPLPDHTGWQITPVLHKAPSGTTDPSNTVLPSPFVVCILGASRGIGASIAYAYALAGASAVVLAGRDVSALEAVAAETRRLGQARINALVTVCEVTSNDSVAALSKLVQSEFGRLDVLVVNAGLWGETAIRVTEGNTKQFQDVVNTDIVGTYLAAHYLLPIVLESESGAKAFVAISGTGAWVTNGPVAHTAHCVSKLAQARLVEHMANDFQEEGLLVVAVHPGCVWTDTSKLAPAMFHHCKSEIFIDSFLEQCRNAWKCWLTKYDFQI